MSGLDRERLALVRSRSRSDAAASEGDEIATGYFVATNLGKAFFDKYAARNKCGTQTQAVSPNGCVQYQGCAVSSTWCLFKGGHTTWSEEPAAIWNFFSQF